MKKTLASQAACVKVSLVKQSALKKYFTSIGRKGGQSGVGVVKVRGGSDYYRRIVALRKKHEK